MAIDAVGVREHLKKKPWQQIDPLPPPQIRQANLIAKNKFNVVFGE
jgi:hypothetical protein